MLYSIYLIRGMDMRGKTVLRVLGSVFCLILSLVFVIAAVAVPFYYSITALTTPKTVAEVVQNVDYKTVVEQSPAIKSTLETYGIDSTAADNFIKSAEVGELIEVYADEATEILLNIPDDRMFDIPLIKEIVDENIDDVIALAEESTGLPLSEENIKKNVDTFIEKNEQQIEEVIPVIEETRVVVKTIKASTVIQKTLTLEFAIYMILAAVLIFALICIIKRTKGFLWLGIDFTVISIILALVVVFSRSDVVNMMALKLSHFETEIIESAISICTDKVIIALCGAAVFAVMFLMFFVVVKLVKRKYQNKTEVDPELIGDNVGE